MAIYRYHQLEYGHFIFMGDPSTLTIVLTQFRKNIKKDQNTHVILHVLVDRHKSISINHFDIIEFYLDPNSNSYVAFFERVTLRLSARFNKWEQKKTLDPSFDFLSHY